MNVIFIMDALKRHEQLDGMLAAWSAGWFGVEV
jgi:hypothetical protein